MIGHRGVAESFQLREDEPDPMPALGAGCQFGERLPIHRLLGIDETPQVVGVVHLGQVTLAMVDRKDPDVGSAETAEETKTPHARSALAEKLRRRKAKRSLFDRVSIQSKLMLMLLAMTILATAVAGGIGSSPAAPPAGRGVRRRLTGIRQAQSQVLALGCPICGPRCGSSPGARR